MRILVASASLHGSTAQIANAPALFTRAVWLFSSGPVGRLRPFLEPIEAAEMAGLAEAREHRVFDGCLDRSQPRCADAAAAREAVDRLAHRLSHRLANLWRRPSRHQNATRPSTTPGRQVVSHVTYSAPGATVEDAIAEMDSLGYDFHLFTDAAGQDCLLRKTSSGYLVAAADGWTRHTPPGVWECVGAAPRLSVEEAQVRFDLAGQRLLFFADTDDNRGRVLYRRDDGDYGLIHPAVTSTPTLP
jgi:hypothetical protein